MEQPGNMMPNGMPQQHMKTMQRPQPGNVPQQIHAKIMDNLQQKARDLPQGWQSTYDIRERALWIMQIITQLSVLHQDVPRCLTIAEGFEDRTIRESPNKEVYKERMSAKMREITQHRQNNAQQQTMQSLQMGMPMNNNGGMAMTPTHMGNLNMMQNMGVGGVGMGMGMGTNMNMNLNANAGLDMSNMNMGMPNMQMGPNGGQQTFPTHLQRQMQPSPLPQHAQPQQQQQNNTLDPSALHNPQMPPQMQTMNPQQAMNMNQNIQSQGRMPTDDEVKQRANNLLAGLSEERKKSMRTQLWAQMSEQQRQQLGSGGGDVLTRYLANRAREMLMKERGGMPNSQPQQNSGGMSVGNNMGVAPTQLQQQPPSTQAGQANIDLSKITDLRANAIKSQESGGEVVPASNHTGFNLAGQMNMPQGVNPQMLGNPNGPNSANPNVQQMQMLAAQRERQKAIARQQAAAQQQAQNNLRGQPGGLGTPNALNGGQVNSPAMNMSMLNRPMVPPGQTTPSTPQQNRPQTMSQTPLNPTNQLQQHHQSMLNQNQNPHAQQVHQIIQSLPPGTLESMTLETRQKLATLQPAQLREVLQRMLAQRQQQLSGGMVNPPIGNMPGPPMGNQQAVNNGLPAGMGNAVPNFTSQPPPNQQPARPNQDAMGFHRLQQHQQIQVKQRAFDMRPFPRDLLQSQGMQVPDAVETWGALKQHIAQNQAVLPPSTMAKVQGLQNQWFDTHPEEVQPAVQEFTRRMRQQHLQNQQAQQPPQQPSTTQPPMSMPMPNGQAPPAQMVPPSAPMQQQPPTQGQNQNQNQNRVMPGQNMMQGQPRLPQFPPPTDADIKICRQRLGPRAVQYSDDQVKALILKMRKDAFIRQQMQQGQPALATGGQPGNLVQVGQQPQQQQPSRPPQIQNPQPVGAAAHGQKRPQTSSDDVVEIQRPSAPPVNNMAQMAAAQQASAQQMLNRPGGMKIFTQEELDKMDPLQRQRAQQSMQQMAALRKAQSEAAHGPSAAMNQQQPHPPQFGQQQPRPNLNQAPQPPNITPEMMQERKQDQEKLMAMWSEMVAATRKNPAVSISADELEQARQILKKLKPLLDKIDMTYAAALHMPNMGEQKVRAAMKAKIMLMQNIDQSTGELKGYLSIALPELKRLEGLLGAYVGQIAQLQKARHGNAQGSVAPNGARPAPQAPAPPAPTAVKQEQQAPPLNRKASQTQSRKQSAKAPPAPTDNKTFDWAVQSPSGVPKYDPGRPELTQEKLRIPAAKKRKTGPSESANSTPTAQTGTSTATVASPASMGAPKPPTPEQMRKMQAQVAQRAEAVRPKFRCEDPACEGSVAGFETEEALKAHREIEHVVIEDPFKFLIDTTEEYARGEDGKPAAGSKTAAQAAGKLAAENKAIGRIVGARAASNTPTPSGKAAGKTPADKKTTETPAVQLADEAPAQEKSLLDVMAEKISFDLPAPDQDLALLALPTTGGEDSAWTEMLAVQFQGADSWVDDWTQFRGVTDWGLGPDTESSPELTPSSSDSQVSRESDISQAARLKINMQWDAWGDGDTGIPAEFDLSLGGLIVDVGTGEGNVLGEDGKKMGEDVMDWSSGLGSWESMFGPDAGMDQVGNWAGGADGVIT